MKKDYKNIIIVHMSVCGENENKKKKINHL
jgi:hypothetical protein